MAENGTATQVLTNLNVDVAGLITNTTNPSPTARAKKVIEAAYNEAENMEHNYVGTEHILIGMMLDEENNLAKELNRRSITLKNVRKEIDTLLVA